MRQSVRYGDERISYLVRFVARRNNRIAIHVSPDCSVHVDAPIRARPEQIKAAVNARARWVSKRIAEFRDAKRQVLPREYVSGECHYYLGRRYMLKVTEGGSVVHTKLVGRYLKVVGAKRDTEKIKQSLATWYSERSLDIFSRRLEAVTKQIKWLRNVPPFRLQEMRTQWGNCSPNGRLVLNPHLVKAPRQCIDYVILHELCHLKEHNHGRKFYRMLSRLMPDWELHKRRLDILANTFLEE